MGKKKAVLRAVPVRVLQPKTPTWQEEFKAACEAAERAKAGPVRAAAPRAKKVPVRVLAAKIPMRLEDIAARTYVDCLSRCRSLEVISYSDPMLVRMENKPWDHILPKDWFTKLTTVDQSQNYLTDMDKYRWVHPCLNVVRGYVRTMLGPFMKGGAWVPFKRQLRKATKDATRFRNNSPLIPWLMQLMFDDTLLILGSHQGLKVSLMRLRRHIEKLRFEFYQLTDLSTDVICGLDSVLIPIITRAPNLRHLYLMDDPISSQNLITIGMTCKNLEILKMAVSAMSSHMNKKCIAMPYTSDVLCKAFFCGMTMMKVQKAYMEVRDIEVSMPKLRHLYLSYIDAWKIWDFTKMVMHYYKNMEEFLSYSLGVQIGYFEDVIYHNAVLAGGSMKLKVVELHSRDLLLPELGEGLLALPKLRELKIFTDLESRDEDREHFILSLYAGKNLKEAMGKLPNVTRLHLNGEWNSTDEDFRAVVLPTMKMYGSRIKVLTIKSSVCSPVKINTYYQVINMCPNLESLRVPFAFVTKMQCARLTTKLNPMEKLNFFLAHDMTNETPSHKASVLSDRPKGSAIGLIKDVFAAARNIETLSVSVDYTTFEEVLRVMDLPKLTVLYIVQVEDESKPPPKIGDGRYFDKVINRCPLLRRVAIKTMRVSTFCEVRQYRNSSLTIENGPYDPRDPIWRSAI